MSWIYKKNRDNSQRYLLGEIEDGEKTLICIGINCSTATPQKLDNTLVRVKARAESLGYKSWLMLNVYPQRATDPNDMDRELNLEGHKKNLKAIRAVIKELDYDVWAAWGTLIEKRNYLSGCLYDIYKVLGDECRWFSIDKRSKVGHPHHPLYMKNGLEPDDFDIKTYTKGFKSAKK